MKTNILRLNMHPAPLRWLQDLTHVLAIIIGLGGTATSVAEDTTPHYEYFVVGNPADASPSQPPLVSTTALMGGGPDVDAAFQWMIAKSGGGDFVVIRSRGTDAYNPYIFAMGGVDSVETLIISSREAANDPFVIDHINKAEALFISNGYQSDYINFWKGTGVDRAIQGLIARNVPIGGTSAGLAILGQFDFAALNGTVHSNAALADPYNTHMTLDRGFIMAKNLDYVITDTHFDFRDRMGRLVAFMARIVQDGWAPMVRGIGVDVGTALLLQDGMASRIGAGSVYFLQTTEAPHVCQSGVPLTYQNVKVQRLSGNSQFDMQRWHSDNNATTNYRLSVEKGYLYSDQPNGKIY